jgi:hypothetical protein
MNATEIYHCKYKSQHPKQGKHTEISCIKEEEKVDIVAENQRPQAQMT